MHRFDGVCLGAKTLLSSHLMESIEMSNTKRRMGVGGGDEGEWILMSCPTVETG